MKFEEETDQPVHVAPTNRSLPAHKLAANAEVGVGAARNAIATVEGPVRPGGMISQRQERNSLGQRFERLVASDLLIALDAVMDKGRGGDVVRIRAGQLDQLWERYDAGDFGDGRPGLGVYTGIAAAEETTLTLWIVDQDLLKNPARPAAETLGPQRLQIALPPRTEAQKAVRSLRTSSRN